MSVKFLYLKREKIRAVIFIPSPMIHLPSVSCHSMVKICSMGVFSLSVLFISSVLSRGSQNAHHFQKWWEESETLGMTGSP